MQKVSQRFHDVSQANIRHHSWNLLMSFNKEFQQNAEFFILDKSLLDGPHLLAPVGDNPLQYWDAFKYEDYSDRVISLEWSREASFPSSVQSALCTVVCNNLDNYFTPRTNSPISKYILPGRPIKVLAGHSDTESLQQFVGVTQGKPELDREARTAKFSATDYLTEIFKVNLSDSVSMSNVRTDEALKALFKLYGIEDRLLNFDKGRNVIPFLFLGEGSNTAEAFKSIMEAEGGRLWIDESGIIRFDQRLAQNQKPVFVFNASNIVSITSTEDSQIINHITIKSNIREVQRSQPIFTGSLSSPTLSQPVKIPSNGTLEYSMQLKDPLKGFTALGIGAASGTSWASFAKENGEAVSSGVSFIGNKIGADALTLTIKNTNPYTVHLTAIEVYGEPAKIVDTIYFEASDPDSIEKYGEHLLKLENDLFGSESNCESYAYTILDSYANLDSTIEMTVKGDYSLQLGDIIKVNTEKVIGTFEIIGMSYSLSSSGVTQTIKARKHTVRNWFILDQSKLNESDVLTP